jgi:hypothetical protein
MERTQIFDLMGELRLYGMKAAFDDIMATAVKRQHEPQRVVGSPSPSCRSPKTSPTSSSPARRSTRPWSKTLPRAAALSPSNAMSCWSAEPILIHDAHLVMSLECKGLLIWILS